MSTYPVNASAIPNNSGNVLRPEWNTPYTLALKFDTGKEVEGRFGNQVMFTVITDTNETKQLYLDMPVAAEIVRLGIRAGVRFSLVKREVKVGRKPTPRWEISLIDPVHPGVVIAQPAQPAYQVQQPGIAAQAVTVRPSALPRTSSQPNDIAVNPWFANAGDAMLACLLTAYGVVDGLTAAKPDLEMNEEDIRNIGVSLFIEYNRSGAARSANAPLVWPTTREQ
jgi:hypothetical protein